MSWREREFGGIGELGLREIEREKREREREKKGEREIASERRERERGRCRVSGESLGERGERV